MKIKIVALIMAILILALYVPVYADTTIPRPPADVMEYWAIYYYRSHGIMLITSNNPITAKITGDTIYATGGYRICYYEENRWKFKEEGNSTGTAIGTMYASNHDIAYSDGSGFFFFRNIVSPLIQTMEETDFGTILKNFSAGLIPILGCLVSVLAFRKAWQFLQVHLSK